jgi:hypothetical protein
LTYFRADWRRLPSFGGGPRRAKAESIHGDYFASFCRSIGVDPASVGVKSRAVADARGTGIPIEVTRGEDVSVNRNRLQRKRVARLPVLFDD